jgi:hypothetical protein
MAYCSSKSNQFELYVQPYPGPGKTVLVSTGVATEPAWSRDGKELYYRSGSKMMAVRFTTNGDEFVPEKPVMLFQGEFATAVPRSYDVSSDGRFLMIQRIPDTQGEWDRKVYPSALHIVLNWTQELQRLMTH